MSWVPASFDLLRLDELGCFRSDMLSNWYGFSRVVSR